jgi:hypothetical protein
LADRADLISLSELARRNRVRKQTVAKRVRGLEAQRLLKTRRKGRIVLVSAEAFDAAVRATENPAHSQRTPRPTAFHCHRARREGFAAERARLDLKDRLTRLVDAGEVERRQTDVFRRVRARMLRLAASVSAHLAAAPNERAARAILEAEVRTALTELAAEFARAAEAGIGKSS